MLPNQAKKLITSGELDKKLGDLYGEDRVLSGRARYLAAINEFAKLYGDERDINIFSVSGRSELSGNHTDHNGGRVIAAAVDLDVIAVASACAGSVIRLKSDGFDEYCVDFDSYSFPKEELFGSSESIISGVISGLNINGFKFGGFDGYMTSNVPVGSGLSSSAVFENLIGTIENHFYNGGEIEPITLAKISKYAETDFFGKPCGLMDQIACAVGGIVAIDFSDSATPVVEPIPFDINAEGYKLCVVNAGGSHANLTDEFASIPSEMKAVAAYFGKKLLCELKKADVLQNIASLRASLGDRAVMRALHFFDENERVLLQKKALSEQDLDTFLANVIGSGRSSFCYLQTIFTPKDSRDQGLSLALYLAESYLKDKKGAWRVHGGGFAGTILAFVPSAHVDGFKSMMDSAFGGGACRVLKIRKEGAERIL